MGRAFIVGKAVKPGNHSLFMRRGAMKIVADVTCAARRVVEKSVPLLDYVETIDLPGFFLSSPHIPHP